MKEVSCISGPFCHFHCCHSCCCCRSLLMAKPLVPQALYMFLALAITCDEYFVTSLEKICEVRGSVFLIHFILFISTASTEPSNSSSAVLSFLVLLSFPPAETGPERGRGGSHLHGSRQLCAGALRIRHWYAPTHSRTHTHSRHSDVPRWLSPLLTPDWLLSPRRCLHHPR